MWIDIYDASAWADPSGTVSAIAAHGVRTLFLQTSNYDRGSSFVFPEQVNEFVDAAHADGVMIVAWYLPGFAHTKIDLKRSVAAIQDQTPAGNRFDGFGLDIEATVVRDPAARTAALLSLTSQLRRAAGPTYPLGAIVPLPQRIEGDGNYWPGFPFADLAAAYDAILPMTYFTYRVSGCDAVHAFVARSIDIVRKQVGSDRVPIHVIGGIAQDSTPAETRCFAQAVRERGVIGASDYTFPGVTARMWSALQTIPSNAV